MHGGSWAPRALTPRTDACGAHHGGRRSGRDGRTRTGGLRSPRPARYPGCATSRRSRCDRIRTCIEARVWTGCLPIGHAAEKWGRQDSNLRISGSKGRRLATWLLPVRWCPSPDSNRAVALPLPGCVPARLTRRRGVVSDLAPAPEPCVVGGRGLPEVVGRARFELASAALRTRWLTRLAHLPRRRRRESNPAKDEVAARRRPGRPRRRSGCRGRIRTYALSGSEPDALPTWPRGNRRRWSPRELNPACSRAGSSDQCPTPGHEDRRTKEKWRSVRDSNPGVSDLTGRCCHQLSLPIEEAAEGNRTPSHRAENAGTRP